jgi:actin, other eukaryote
MRLDIAGRDVDYRLEQLLRQGRRTPLPASLLDDRAALEELVHDIKLRHAHVAPPSPAFFTLSGATYRAHRVDEDAAAVSYALPDGTVLRLGGELSDCMEGLFDPSVVGFSAPGMADTLYSAIMRTDADLPRDRMFANVVLSGGTTTCRGFAERLHAELVRLAPPSARIKVVQPAEKGMCANWAGGAQLASLPAFEPMWITRSEYDEEGPRTVHRKCY